MKLISKRSDSNQYTTTWKWFIAKLFLFLSWVFLLSRILKITDNSKDAFLYVSILAIIPKTQMEFYKFSTIFFNTIMIKYPLGISESNIELFIPATQKNKKISALSFSWIGSEFLEHFIEDHVQSQQDRVLRWMNNILPGLRMGKLHMQATYIPLLFQGHFHTYCISSCYLYLSVRTRQGFNWKNHNTRVKHSTWTDHVWISLPMHLSCCLQNFVQFLG